MSDIKDSTRTLGNELKKDYKLHVKSGEASVTIEVPADLYAKTLPEGITIEQVEQLEQHNTAFAAGAFLALGETAIPAFKKHKDLQEVQIEIPTVGKSTFKGVFERSSQVRAPGATESTTKFGTGSMKLDFYGGGNSRGEFKKVREFLTDKAAEALAD